MIRNMSTKSNNIHEFNFNRDGFEDATALKNLHRMMTSENISPINQISQQKLECTFKDQKV